jgi:hypothetical protein
MRDGGAKKTTAKKIRDSFNIFPLHGPTQHVNNSWQIIFVIWKALIWILYPCVGGMTASCLFISSSHACLHFFTPSILWLWVPLTCRQPLESISNVCKHRGYFTPTPSLPYTNMHVHYTFALAFACALYIKAVWLNTSIFKPRCGIQVRGIVLHYTNSARIRQSSFES